MKKFKVMSVLILVACSTPTFADKQIQALEERISKLEKAIGPFLEEQERLEVIKKHKLNARSRMKKDSKIYSNEELKEIESLYQVANKKWRSEEGKKSLELLISKFDKANRTGCATLYLGQMSKGDAKKEYLKKAIDKFSDCYYGNGVQVGAYARFLLVGQLLHEKENKKALKIIKNLKNNYPKAIDHRGKLLEKSIDEGLKQLKLI